MESIKAKLDKLRFSENDDEESQLLISRAERIIEEIVSFERQQIIDALISFKSVMKNGNTVEKRKAKEGFSVFLNEIDDIH